MISFFVIYVALGTMEENMETTNLSCINSSFSSLPLFAIHLFSHLKFLMLCCWIVSVISASWFIRGEVTDVKIGFVGNGA